MSQPTDIIAGASVTTPIACFDGTAIVTVTASGGTGAFEYVFNGVSQITGIFSGISAHNGYAWSVKDVNGCEKTGTLDVSQPTDITASASVSIAIPCYSETATVTVIANGGTGAYTYIFNGVSQSSGIFSGISAHIGYAYSVKDANNCVKSGTLDVSQPTNITGGASVTTPILCSGGVATVTVTASGGSGGYSYIFDGVTQSSGIFSGITAKTGYIWFVKDANGCEKTGTLNVSQPDALSMTADVVNELCFGGSNGSISLTVSGGTAPYAYYWSNNPFEDEPTITGLIIDTYSVTVTDHNNCKIYGTF